MGETAALAKFWCNTSFHIATQTTHFTALYGIVRYGVGTSIVASVDKQLVDRDGILDVLKLHLLRAQNKRKSWADSNHQDITFDIEERFT